MRPDRVEAEKLLKEAEACNPGPWAGHSRTAAHCAEKIALYSGLDPDKWNDNLALKAYFEEKMDRDLYDAVEKDNFRT